MYVFILTCLGGFTMKKRFIATSLLVVMILSSITSGCDSGKTANDVPPDLKSDLTQDTITIKEELNEKKEEPKETKEDQKENKEDSKETIYIEEEAPEEKTDTSSLDNTKTSWWFKPNANHTTPEINTKLSYKLEDYDAHYVGDTTRKVLYLTFDEGYENGYTAKILDTLKANDVKAIFFVTSPYVKGNPDLIKRMVDEGHIVGNHTNHHPSMPDVCGNEEKFKGEFTDVADKYKEITGKDMPMYFRPPMGEYSQKSLAMTKNLGYKTVFWSFAYHDWDIKKQPDPVKAKEKILGGLHNGCIMLVHAVSKTNSEILDSVLKEAKAQGYTFELLP